MIPQGAELKFNGSGPVFVHQDQLVGEGSHVLYADTHNVHFSSWHANASH